MKRALKIFAGVVVVLIAIVVGGLAWLSALDPNEYKADISQQVKEATGRDLVLKGALELSLGMTTKVAANDVSLSNAKWAAKPEMVKFKRFEAVVSLLPLLSGTIHVNQITLADTTIQLETDAKGMGNWVMGGGRSCQAGFRFIRW